MIAFHNQYDSYLRGKLITTQGQNVQKVQRLQIPTIAYNQPFYCTTFLILLMYYIYQMHLKKEVFFKLKKGTENVLYKIFVCILALPSHFHNNITQSLTYLAMNYICILYVLIGVQYTKAYHNISSLYTIKISINYLVLCSKQQCKIK